MLRRSAFALSILALVSCRVEGAQAGPPYALFPLLPAADAGGSSVARGIDANGDVVGYCTNSGSLSSLQNAHGMLYTGGMAYDLGTCPAWTPPGGGIISVAATTFNGVARSASTGDLLIAGDVGYTWSGGAGTPTNLPILLDYNPTTRAETWYVMPSQYNGGVYSYNGGNGYGVNANGQFVGDNLNSSQEATPFVCTLAGTQTNLASLPGMSPNGLCGANVWAIDSAGDVAGKATNSAGVNHLMLYVAATNSMADLGANGVSSVTGMYCSGDNIYISQDYNGSGTAHQAVYTYNVTSGSVTSITDLGASGQATGINASLTEVGTGGVAYNATTAGAAWVSLYNNTLIPGITSSSWSSLSNQGPWMGINNAGQIVGTGTYGGGQTGYLLTPAQPGDANLDGRVDINDLTIVLANYGKAGMTWTQGEFTGDGTVDINDLTIVLANYGQGVAAPAAGVAAVPEPSSLILVGLGAVALLVCVRGCRRP